MEQITSNLLCSFVSLHDTISNQQNVKFLLPPAMKMGQVNIFSNVCQEFCSQVGEYLGRYPSPTQVHSPGRYNPPHRAGTPPVGRYPPWAGTSPNPGRYNAPGQLHPLVNERTVRILLECILVFITAVGR